MANFFKSRFFAVLLIIAIALCVLPTTLSFMGQGDYVRSAVLILVSPFEKAGRFCAESLRGFSDYFFSYQTLKEENARLKEELRDAEEKLYEASLFKEENEWLRSYLELKKLHYDFTFADSKLIGRETVNTRALYVLTGGTLSGITPGMPVVTDRGLLGYVVEVEATRCKAVSISAERSSVGIYDERSGTLGVMKGSYEFSLEGLCEITVTEENADLRPGDRILTSGLGNIYPEGLLVGTIKEVSTDPYTRMPRATVQPAVDFSDVSDLMILTGFSAASLSDTDPSDGGTPGSEATP